MPQKNLESYDSQNGSLLPLVKQTEELMLELSRACPSSALGEMLCSHLQSGGKRLRAQLALASVRALGQNATVAVPWAAACELLHNATLIHDDLQDGDRYRRGRETLWFRYGQAQAINAGDLMLVLPYLAVDRLQSSEVIRWQLSRALAAHSVQTAAGQAEEFYLGLDENPETLREHYQQVCRGKTSALFELPVLGAALLAEKTQAEAQSLAREFSRLGLIFQMCDDLLDVMDGKGRLRAGEDIRERKITCLVVEHLRSRPQDREKLQKLFAKDRDQVTDQEVKELLQSYFQEETVERVVEQLRALSQEFYNSMVLRESQKLHEEGCRLMEKIMAPVEVLSSGSWQ